MAESDLIKIYTNIDFFDVKDDLPNGITTIYTGPIDKFFNFEAGLLSWRTLDFELKSMEINDFQGTSVMNYADESVKFTRIHEFKHLHPERGYEKFNTTVVAYEFSRFAEKNDEPYYPVNLESDKKKLLAYRGFAKKKQGIFFGGRLGSYKYLDMHMAIASAMNKWDNEILPYLINKP
jgi:UDP-galactopyranose mutase